MPLRYATENPFTKSYRAGEEYGQEKRLREQRLRSGDQDYATKEELRGPGLRRSTAEADTAESTARVKTGTEGYDIARSGSESARAGTEADKSAFDLGEDRANAPNIRTKNEAGARGAQADADRSRTQADKATFDLGEDRATAPDARRKSRADADRAGTDAAGSAFELGEKRATAGDARRTAAANATTAEEQARGAKATTDFALNRRTYDLFDKSMAALAQGNVEMALAYAQQNGQQIPPEILKDVRKQRAMAKLWEDAKQRYPNQPRAQVEFLKHAVQQMMTTAGELEYDPVKSLGTQGAPESPVAAAGLLRSGQVPASQVDGMPGLQNLSAADARLIAQVKLVATDPAPYGFGDDVVDVRKMGQELSRLGRPDLARIFDPSVQAPGQAPMLPQGAGVMAPRGPQPQGQPGGPSVTPPYIPQGQPQPSQVPPGAMNAAPQAGARPPTPPQLRSVAQLQYSPKNNQFRDAATGYVYDISGNRLR